MESIINNENKTLRARTLLENYKFKAGEHIGNSDYDLMIDYAKEFARHHVEAALKEAAQKASLLENNKKVASPRYIIEDSNNNYNQTEIDIDKDSILDAYPLTIIK